MSIGPIEIRPWRESPFKQGKRYRIRQSFSSLRDSFTVGEILEYDRDAWSRYDDITAYCFKEGGQKKLGVWDIDDDSEICIWKEFFEELANPTIPNSA